MQNNNKKIEIYDTTLRDGAQSEGVNFSVSDKLKILKLLDNLGVDYIELGWPGANPKDIEVFNQAKKINLINSKIAAFGCTRKPDTQAKDDIILNTLLKSDTDVITIFGKTWDFHVINALNTTLEENLNMIYDSITYLKSKNKKVFFDAEHFFDGFKQNKDYAIQTILMAFKASCDRIILCDTNGGCTNNDVFNITKEIFEILSNNNPENKEISLGIHAHNDGDMAVANSIAAIQAGAIQVQGTINGYGERCGNANLCSIIPNLQLKLNYNVLNQENISKLTYTSNCIAEIVNILPPSNLPFVGRSAFAHKAGVHASGVRKNSQTYEHINPELIGNTRKILISDQAGAASLREKIKNLKLINQLNNDEIPKIIDKLKTLEWEGYAFEGAEASFELLVMELMNIRPKFFKVLGFRVIGDTFDNFKHIITEASIKLKIDDEIIHTVSEGDGPVNSIDKAIRKALIPIYPEVKLFRLNDFKVRILDSKSGTAAKVRVNIETTDGLNKWDTVGVSENIIQASYCAILDSINFGLLFNKAKARL